MAGASLSGRAILVCKTVEGERLSCRMDNWKDVPKHNSGQCPECSTGGLLFSFCQVVLALSEIVSILSMKPNILQHVKLVRAASRASAEWRLMKHAACPFGGWDHTENSYIAAHMV